MSIEDQPALNKTADTDPIKPRLISRRTAFKGAIGIVLGGILYEMGDQVYDGVKSAYESGQDDTAQANTEQLFENEGLAGWNRLTIVPQLLVMDPSIKVSHGMFDKPKSSLVHQPGQFVIAAFPIAVKPSILRNVDDYYPDTQGDIDRALPAIPEGLMAFYQPGPGKLVYCDADINDGLITPLSNGDNPTIYGKQLGASPIDVDGREVRVNSEGVTVFFPYTSSLSLEYPQSLGGEPRPTETYQFIGQSITPNSITSVAEIANKYYNGIDPVGFPPVRF